MITFPLVVFLIVAAEPIIVTLISEKWLPSVVLLQLLLLANIFNPQYTININILNAIGASGTTLKLEIIKKSLIMVSILACFSFGIEAMLAGFVVANVLAYVISMVSIKKELKHFYRHQVGDVIKMLVIAIVLGVLIWFYNYISLGHLVKLFLQGISYTILYLWALKLYYPENLTEIKGMFSKK